MKISLLETQSFLVLLLVDDTILNTIGQRLRAMTLSPDLSAAD